MFSLFTSSHAIFFAVILFEGGFLLSPHQAYPYAIFIAVHIWESQVVINKRLLKYFDHVAYQAQHLRGGPNTLLETELLKQNFY
ncbi:unnamed protein product [Sphagnum jensenii]